MTIKELKMNNKLRVAGLTGGSAVDGATALNLNSFNSDSNKVRIKGQTNGEAKNILTKVESVVEEAVSEDVALKQEVISNSTMLANLTDAEITQSRSVISEKLRKINLELKGEFLERDDVIDDLIRGLVSEQHVLLLGPPGTAKSALAKSLTARITDARIFSWLLNRTSDVSELLGPISIKHMEQDKFKRKLDGKLGDAEIAFIDEIFKCNEPVLNTMLPILNERIVYNDGETVSVPLKMMIAASNETPDGDELGALYDRILIKHNIGYIKDPANRQKMIEAYDDRNNPRSNKVNVTTTTISLQELAIAQYSRDMVKTNKDVIKALGGLLNHLTKEGISFSDRKVNWCLDVMKANAFIDNRDQLEVEDLSALVYILWEREEDVDTIKRFITKLVDPYKDKMDKYYTDGKNIVANAKEVTLNDPKEAVSVALEAKTQLTILIQKMSKVLDEAKGSNKLKDAMVKQRDTISSDLDSILLNSLGIKSDNPLNNVDLPF